MSRGHSQKPSDARPGGHRSRRVTLVVGAVVGWMLLGAVAVHAEGEVSLTVTPASGTFSNGSFNALVTLDNQSTSTISDVTLSWAVNGAGSIVADPPESTLRTVAPGSAIAWSVKVSGSDLSDAAIVFRVSYREQAAAANGETAPPQRDRIISAELKLTAEPAGANASISTTDGELSEQTTKILTVVITNTSSRSLSVQITPPQDDSIVFSPPDSSGQVEAGDQVAFPFTLTGSGRLTAGEHIVTFTLAVVADGSTVTRRSTVAATVTVASRPLASLSVAMGDGDLSEQTPVTLTILVSNTSGADITADLRPRPDDFVCFATPQPPAAPSPAAQPSAVQRSAAPASDQERDGTLVDPCAPALSATVASGDQGAVTFNLSAKSRVRSGDHPIAIDVTVRSGEVVDRSVLTDSVTLTVLGNELLETPLAIPAFYLLPGAIMVVVFGWTVKLWGPVSSTGLGLTPFEKEFWILAIGLSFAFSAAYSLVTGFVDSPVDLLGSTGYGTLDVIRIWGLSIGLPIAAYGLIRAGQAVWNRDDINPRDDALSVLRKMGDVTPVRPSATVDAVHGFLAQDALKDGGYWIIPPIEVRWLHSSTVKEKQDVGDELRQQGSAARLAVLLKAAVDQAHATVLFRRSGAFVGPRKFGPDKITAFGAPGVVVSEGG